MHDPYPLTPYYRPDDNELIGYLLIGEQGTTPLTVFGYPLSAPGDHDAALELLRQRGLAVLAEPWWYTEEDGSGFPVRIISAYPDSVAVARADYGFVSHDAKRRSLPVPAGERLRPFPPA